MATNGKSVKFEPLALLMAAGANVKQAAEQTGTAERTAYRVTATVEFRRRVNEIRSEIAAATVGTLTMAASEAAATLRELLSVANEANTRLNAAKAILANVGPLSELGELRRRLDELEKRA